MRYECVSADADVLEVRDPEVGRGWLFPLVDEHGHRDIAAEDVQERPAGERPAPFVAVAGADLFALRRARPRGLIDG